MQNIHNNINIQLYFSQKFVKPINIIILPTKNTWKIT